MTDFEVVYECNYLPGGKAIFPSRVFAVEQNNFLIVDGWGKFRWVPMKACTERSVWELENGSVWSDKHEESVTQGYWDDPTSENYVCKDDVPEGKNLYLD